MVAAVLVSGVGLQALRDAGPAAASTVTGIDVASYQHPGGAPINWSQVKGAGHAFAYVKATESTTYTNPYFAGDWPAISGAGLYRGAYHYARPALPISTAQAQARYFVSKTGSMGGPLDLPPMLDMEETGGLGPANLAAWSLAFMQEVEALTGRRPVLYTGYYFWLNELGGTTSLAGYRLWLPWYTTAAAPGAVPTPWGTWTFWQHSSTGAVPGIIGNVDMNRFCCPLSSLAAMAGPGTGTGVGNPFGSFDGAARLPGTIQVSGWAIDPDTTGPVQVHLYADGAWAGATTADVSRPDVGSAYPGFGNRHGFDATVTVPAGASRVCAYAVNVGAGTSNPLLGCRTVTSNPIGNLESAQSAEPGTLSVGGWALDPDTTGPIDVHLYLDGLWVRSLRADVERPDVEAAFPGAGSTHGFATTIAAVGGGTRQVCVYAINVGAGTTNPSLGCRTVVVLAGTPVGNVDAVSPVFGAVDMSGWALDPDTSASIDVEVHLDGRKVATVTADGDRPDVWAAYPLYGPAHGFAHRIEGVGGGRHTVCAYGVNVDAGSGTPRLACRDVVVSGDPGGSLDSAEPTDRLRVQGWAIDPDTTNPIDVHLYVNGRWAGMGRADQVRHDVGAAYPAYGPGRGYDISLAHPGDGTHQVCAYGINVGPGGNKLLDCRTITVRQAPFGNLEGVSRVPGGARLQGWAIDPDASTTPVAVHIYVDGAWGGAALADGVRPDVGAAYPGAGTAHGLDVVVPLGAGPRQVCAYLINLGPGATNPLLGCRTV